MSIKEALKRDIPPPKQMDRREWDGWSRRLRRERYDHSFLILEESGSLDLLRELSLVIESNFPDVVLIQENHPTTGEVCLALEWDYEKKFPDSDVRNCNRLSIHADPWSGFISVQGNNVFTVLGSPQWRDSRAPLENAIVLAYNDPTTWVSILDCNKNAEIIPIDTH